MVLIEFFLIAVAIFVAILCLKHDLDKKREKLLDEMTKKITENANQTRKQGTIPKELERDTPTNITTGK